jgi:hypothetical protein
MPDTPVEPSPGGRYPADMESRVAVLEQIARTTVASLERIERRFEAIDRRLEAFDRRFEGLDRRIDALTMTYRADFCWLLGIILGGFGAMLGVMAHGFRRL